MSINSNRFTYLPKTCIYIVYIRVCFTSGISKGILSRWHLAPTPHLTFEKGCFRNKKNMDEALDSSRWHRWYSVTNTKAFNVKIWSSNNQHHLFCSVKILTPSGWKKKGWVGNPRVDHVSTLVGPAGKKDAWKGHKYIQNISLRHLEFLGFCNLFVPPNWRGVETPLWCENSWDWCPRIWEVGRFWITLAWTCCSCSRFLADIDQPIFNPFEDCWCLWV